MAHLAILLGGWDWVQLANISRKADKHKDLTVTTLKNLSVELKKLQNNDKIHVVGHGGINTFASNSGITPEELADAIHKDLPAGTKVKIRLDTCFSGVEVGGTSTAKIISEKLKKSGRKAGDIEVSGTTGPSITGVDNKRIVVDPQIVDWAFAIQQILEILHETSIDDAKKLVQNVDEDTSSKDIIKEANKVRQNVKGFFDDFGEVLSKLDANRAGIKILIDHAAKSHKKIYTT